MTTRRRILRHLAGVTGAVGLSGCAEYLSPTPETDLGLPENPRADDLPARQHALNDSLRTDDDGNPLSPGHHAVLLLNLSTSPGVERARTVERAMRTLEAAYDWTPDGLFHLLAWGPKYFSRVDALDGAPVRRPQVLSRTDDPKLEDYDAALVLASDVPSHLRAVENAMFRERSALNGEPVEDRLGEVFDVTGRRTGFVGEGLPAEHAASEGIPGGDAVSEDAPMFMGFFSGRRKTQASEDRVTISSGEYAGGTTMHLSHLRQSLSRWYETLDERERVQRMFSADLAPEDVAALTDDVPFADAVTDHAREHDVVGHFEKVAQARRDGEPILLRRDFNTVDGGRPGVHFLALQRSLDDFAETRRAMNGWYVRDDSDRITDRKNNGILDFVTVVSRANFYVPPRDGRAFPRL